MLGIRECTYKIKRKCKNGKTRTINLKHSKVNTHMLRHTFATRWIEAGKSPYALQRILGHVDIKTTLNTYTSIYNSFKETEAEGFEEYKKTKGLY